MILTEQEIKADIISLKGAWGERNQKFKHWYEILTLVDFLATRGMESSVSNEPGTFYNMAHYLLTKGEVTHSAPIEIETSYELDQKAKLDRACKYMWSKTNIERRYGGTAPFIEDLGFYLLILGWFCSVSYFDKATDGFNTQLWCPMETYPRYANNYMSACVHSYPIPETEARLKAEQKGWDYQSKAVSGKVILDDYFIRIHGSLYNMVLINSKKVTDLIERPDMQLIVAPVGGFPDRGSLSPTWKKQMGRSIFAINETVTTYFNKWNSMIAQILKDTAQTVTEEFSSSPQATPEQLRERGALFHYAPEERGLVHVPPPNIPGELQGHLNNIQKELQKGSFNDAVFGMMGGQAGYALSLLSEASTNQILSPYMDAKHFIISEIDKFWLTQLKTSGNQFFIKGKLIETLTSAEIPEEVLIQASSDIATPKDWMERGTIANLLKDHIDEATIITEVLKFSDPQAIKQRKSLDKIMEHPISQMVKMISGYQNHAEYLDARGDWKQADLFRKAAASLEAQLGAPAPGQAKPEEASRVEAERTAGAPPEKTRVSPEAAPPEATQGYSPQQLRQLIGAGKIAERRE